MKFYTYLSKLTLCLTSWNTIEILCMPLKFFFQKFYWKFNLSDLISVYMHHKFISSMKQTIRDLSI